MIHFIVWLMRDIDTTLTTKANISNRERIIAIPDFSMSEQLLLTNAFLLNHWFVSILEGLHGYVYTSLLLMLTVKGYYSFLMILLTLKAVFLLKPKEPPDKEMNEIDSPTSTSEGDLPRVIVNPVSEEVLLQLDSTSSDDTLELKQVTWDDKKCMRRLRTVISNLVTTLSSSARVNNTGLNIDLDSSNFAVDGGSSDHVCSERSLFIGDIAPLSNVNLQGIGGTVPAVGYGTIRFILADDTGVKHVFTIHNVLYVPNAPMNLLSPQKWVAGRSN